MTCHSRPLPALILLLGIAAAGSPSMAQNDPPKPSEDGVFITVGNPITSEVVNRVRNLTGEILAARRGRIVSRIVFDFNPGEREASSPDFGPCYDLAKHIKSLQNTTTVAFVHNKVSRHTVLPVLACKELVMGSADASWLGRIIDDPKGRIDAQDAKVYEQFAGDSRSAIVQKMHDAGVELMKGRRNNAEFYFDRRRQADAVALGVVGGELVVPSGEVLFLNSDTAIRLGLCKLGNKPSRRQVADAYGLSADSLRSDPLRGHAPVARLVTLKGEISNGMKESILRRISRARDEGANTFILIFNELGGSPQIARSLADELARIAEDEKNPTQLIAFIPFQASDSAVFLAIGCTDIVMSEDATIGDFGGRLGLGPQRGGDLPAIKASLRQLMELRDYDPAIAEGMLELDAELFRVRTRKAPFERRIMLGSEVVADQRLADPIWQVENQIKHKGKPFVLDGKLAQELKLARHVVKSRDVKEVYAEYGLESDKVKETTPDWLDQIAGFLRLPAVRFLLVMVGITCLILEFKIPGATAPGVIAAVCFVLFFWAQMQAINGQIVILAILLFLLGLILIGIEVFVLPGFGFVGISGILLMVIGLGLATVERAPQSGSDWMELGAKLTQFLLGIMLAGFAALALARYLPNIPVANRMILPPPGDPDIGESEPSLPGATQAAALFGAVGTAATMLRPAGMAMFGDQYVDVVTEGGYIPAGARVQVIEVEGTRIVVKEV